MPARYRDLVASETGLQKTHVLGVELDRRQFAIAGDDLGLFFIVPWLAFKLGLPVGRAFDLLFESVIAASFIAGTLGFLALTPGRWARAVAIGTTILTLMAAWRCGDVYVVLGALPIALVPWVLAAVRRSSPWVFVAVGAFAGASIVLANFVRSWSGTSLAAFLILAWVLGREVPFRARLAGLGAAFLCFALIWTALHSLIARRDAFLRAYTSNDSLLHHGHAFWHAVYLGLGYVKNDEVPQFLDEVAIAKVCSVDPGAAYVSSEYERVLRTETLELMRTRPALVIGELLVKTAVVLAYVLVFGNIGWWAVLRGRLAWPFALPFFAGIAFNSVFGILVMPRLGYILGAVAYSALFGATSFMLALEGGSLAKGKRVCQFC